MAIEILHTLMTCLIIEEGLEVSENFLRDLSISYQSIAEALLSLQGLG